MTEVKFGHIILKDIKAAGIDGARGEILNLLERISDGTTIYFDGWHGMGTTAVLRSIAHVLHYMQDPHPKLCFGRIIYIDCSKCKSKRVMQRRIAEELKLDSKIMVMFNKQDEEDDFHGVDPTSRNEIRDVAAVIHRTLRESRFMMIFLNGSDEEVVLSRLGVSELNECVIIWTFKKGFPMKGLLIDYSFATAQDIRSRLRNTDIFLACKYIQIREIISALVHEEAASILTHHPYMRDNDRAMVIDCYLYVVFLLRSFQEGTSRLWAAHGANYWICDGIIQGSRTRDICKALCQEVSFDSLLHSDPSYMFPAEFSGEFWEHVDLPPHWISITSEDMIFRENMENIELAIASSVFLTFAITNNSPQGLPDDLMEQCNNLRVLILSNCAFNFLSPPFGHCSTLRFLGLEHCINNNTTELLVREDSTANWTCLRSLWVLDVRHTDWVEILSEGNMDLMGNIMELDIEGSMCWQDVVAKLEGRLPLIERLRIVKPHRREADASKEIIDSSFMGKTKLQVLDFSDNKDMEKLPTSLSEASSLEVLVLDGCDGLRNVVLSNSKLRSFSFDGYGPASNWTSMHELPLESSRQNCHSDDNKKDVETSLTTLKVSSKQLKNLFLRGLPNLVELDLSGCAIKILDLETMVVDVPRLKRLFLIGCEHLCAIRWGPITDIEEMRMTVDLELLCIDTRPGDGVPGRTRPFIAEPNNFELQVHAVTADARLVRSLWDPIHHHAQKKEKDVFFYIRITSSSISCDEKTSEEHQQYHVMTTSPYDDVSTSVTRVQAFPQPPASWLDRHIEIGDGSHSVGSEVEVLRTDTPNLARLMDNYVQSLHVHDTSTSTATPEGEFSSLNWCRVERCPRLDPVFPPAAGDLECLETIWASDLLMARCIWSKSLSGNDYFEFKALQHLHLRSCPSLQFALPVGRPSLPMLEIIHCSSLTHVFVLDNMKHGIPTCVSFPELTTIHLHDVPALRQICEVKTMLAPKLDTMRTRGCSNLRRLPAIMDMEMVGGWWKRPVLKPVERGRRRPAVEMEKDVWDKLEWDGVQAGHHPSLYETPLHSRYYKRRHLRTSVLR